MALNEVRTIDDRVRVRTALVSVWDKTGLDALVSGLTAAAPGVRILSTGGTYTEIQKILGPQRAQTTLRRVSDYTGQPEMQGGLVKTLDFRIYLGLLSETYNSTHAAELARAGAVPIDLVVVNLYPFSSVVSRADASPESARSNIDIGGPCMLRAAAKNYHRVAVVVDPSDYSRVLGELAACAGSSTLATRWWLACKAFAATAGYDAAISAYLEAMPFPRVRSAYEVNSGM